MSPDSSTLPSATDREVRRQVADFARRHERRRHLLPRAFLVGLLAGLLAVLFRYGLERLDRLRGDLFLACHRPGPWAIALPIALCAAGSAGAVGLVRRFAPEASCSGIPQLKAVLHQLSGLRWRRLLAVKFGSGLLGIGSGLALGREGPTVQMGGALGEMVSRWLRVAARERQILISGGGGPLVERTLAGQIALTALPGLLLLRFLLTLGSYGTSAAGGIFAPLLVLGAQLGLLVGLLGQDLLPAVVTHPASFAIVGMGALFAAIVRAPLTAIVLLEMTESYSLMLPLLVACFVAYLCADVLRDQPIYESLLERDLKRSQEPPDLEGTLLLDLVVQPGAAFAGQRLADLALPKGALVVSVQRGPRSDVPSGDTVFQSGDRITVAVAADAAPAVSRLREGTEAPPRH